MSIAVQDVRSLIIPFKLLFDKEKELKSREGFNIFSILRNEHDEEKLHSAFLSKLLDCNESHNFNSIFLKHFVDNFCPEKFTVDETVRVYTERFIHSVGRIDILIENNKGEAIAIENKIYAKDQPYQLYRYKKFLDVAHKNKSTSLFYLTLEGNEPEEHSISNNIDATKLVVGEDYQIISYKFDILNWINLCMKESVRHPAVREVLIQYSNLIEKLTNQQNDLFMNKELRQMLSENYEAARTIADNIWRLEIDAVAIFLKEIKSNIQERLGDQWQIDIDEDLNKSWAGLNIFNHHWDKDISVRLEGQSKIASSYSIYGIRAHKSLFTRAQLKELLKPVEILQNGFKESDYWPYYKRILEFGSSSDRARLFNITQRRMLVLNIAEQLVELCLNIQQILQSIKKVKSQIKF